MVLSIIVISHNQRWQLKRCVDSILTMPMPFKHEIFISDDASSDGTWELAKEYAGNHANIKALQCNSDDYNPTNDGSRGCWNRCYAYPFASGKYIAFVDGDDFFIDGSDIYKQQVDLLEQNPGCSCCMANDYLLQEDEDVSQVKLRHEEIKATGEILSSEDYVRNSRYFHESHCCVFRRYPDADPVRLYGGYFEDAVITSHYLQYGDIVCLNDAGYVYVQYPSSIWAQQVKSKDSVIFAHALYIPKLIPKWSMVMLSSPSRLGDICGTIRSAYSMHRIKEENLQWTKSFNLFIYNAFNRKLGLLDKLYLAFLWVFLRTLTKMKPKNGVFYQSLPYIL